MKTLSYLEHLLTVGINLSKDLLCAFPGSFQSRRGESENVERTIEKVKDLPLNEVEEKLGIDVIAQRPTTRTGYPRSRYYAPPRKLSEARKARRRDQAVVDSFLKKKEI